MCTLPSAITHCVKSSHEPSKSHFFILITNAITAKSWKQAKWEEFGNGSVHILCPGDEKPCQGDVKWESGIFPESCVQGLGWQGTLDISFSDGFFILNWTVVVKQAKCVHRVTLTDKSADMEKFLWTTFTKVTFSLYFKKDICILLIRLDYLEDQCNASW